MNGLDNLMDSTPLTNPLSGFFDDEGSLDSSLSSASISPGELPFDIVFETAYDSSGQVDGLSETTRTSAATTPPSKPVAKRRRENRYKNAPPSVLSRRRAQNRASQRAYRERKDQRIKELEDLLGEVQQRNDALSQAYAALQSENMDLKNQQQTTHQLQQACLMYDPIIGVGTNDLDMFQYRDSPGYSF
jgi:AP-1-like factor